MSNKLKFPITPVVKKELAHAGVRKWARHVRVNENSYKHLRSLVDNGGYSHLTDEERHAIALSCCLTHPDHSQDKRWAWLPWGLLIIVLALLVAIPAKCQTGTSQIDVIQFQDSSGNPIKSFAAPFKIKCGLNLTCTASGSILTMTPAGGSGSPGGVTANVQYNNAGSFGGVTDGAIGQVLLGQGSGNPPVFADPQVQGTVAAGSASQPNPMVGGGWDGAAVRSLKTDSSGVLQVNLTGLAVACSGLPALTGDVTSSSGSCATTLGPTVPNTKTFSGTLNAANLERIFFSDQYGNGTTTGIASAITAAGSSTPTEIWVPSNYPTTEIVPGSALPYLSFGTPGGATAATIEVRDYRYGGDWRFAVNPPGNPLDNGGNAQFWNKWVGNYTTSFATAFSNPTILNLNNVALDGGINILQNGYSNKTVYQGIDGRILGYTPGQKTVYNAWPTNFSTGDTIAILVQSVGYGGFVAGGDESVEAVDQEVYQGNVEYTGTTTTNSTGATSIVVSPTAGSLTQGAGRYLTDNTTGTLSAGTITAITFTNATTPVAITGSSTTFGTSTVNTTSNTAVTTPNTTVVITPVSMTNITNGLTLCIADNKEFEKVKASSVTGTTFTATFRYPHPSGFIIAAAGACGYYIAFTADNATTAIYGSTAIINQGGTVSNGNVVNTLRAYLIPMIRSTSNTAADIWLTSPVLGYISYRGQWTSGGTNTYTMYQGAEVTSVQTAGVLSNTLTVEPNNVPWTSGDTVAEAVHFSIQIGLGQWALNKFSPTSQGSSVAAVPFNLYGLWNSNDRMMAFVNNTPASRYVAGGGVLSGPIQFLSSGTFSIFWEATSAPSTWLQSDDATNGTIIFRSSANADDFKWDQAGRKFGFSTGGAAANLTIDPTVGKIATTGATGGLDVNTAPATTGLRIPVAAGAAPTVSGQIAYDSTANAYEGGVNGTKTPFTMTIVSGTSAMTTAGITTGACGTTVTTAATGTATTDVIAWARNAAPTNANGGNLILNAWPTANNVNFNYCNPSAATVTPTAMTVNWRVIR